MKKLILIIVTTCLGHFGNSQVTVSNGAQMVTSGNASVVFNNIGFVVDGTFVPGNGSAKFIGDQSVNLSGASSVNFNILEIAKPGNAKLLLQRNVNIGYSVNLLNGHIDLNNNNIILAPTAFIAGEAEHTRIMGTNGGYIEITQELNAPFGINPGNLGASITSNGNLGIVTIRRGHNALSGTGLLTGINRHFTILPTNNTNLDATVRVKYLDAELNGQAEAGLVQYKSSDNGVNWSNQQFTSRDAIINFVEKTGHNSMSIFTLASDNTEVPPPPPTDPVTGLVFNAKRKKPTEVELTWTTGTETNLNGFEVQRRLLNEPDFSVRIFVNSQAPTGTSSSPLAYLYKDANTYTDTSFYRLKLVDNTGNFSYSDVRAVPAKTKGGGGGNGNGNNNREVNESIDAKPVHPGAIIRGGKITVGPNPNNGQFWFVVSGIEKETVANLCSFDGKVLKQFKVNNDQRHHVSGLNNGIYLLRVPGIDAFKVIVQGSNGNTGPSPISPTNTKY
jgi:hypothetical protein